jgi:apolipoprotein N-acyltransferase
MNLPRLDTQRQRLIAAIASGIMIAIAMSLHPWWPIAWIAATPLLAASFSTDQRETVKLAVIAALIGSLSTTIYYFQLAGLLLALAAPIVRALALVVTVSLARRAVVQWRHWLSVFVYPALTAGFDMLESSFSAHGSSASFAYSQMNAIPVIQIASLAGTSGIVFVVNLFAVVLAIAWYQRSLQGEFRRSYAVAGAVMIGVLLFGYARLALAQRQPEVPIGMVVEDTPPNVQASSIDAPVWTAYKAGIDDVVRRGARIVVLPEKIATFTPEQAEVMRQTLDRFGDVDNAYILVGVTIAASDHKENRAWLLSPEGILDGDYSKRHLVPGFEDKFVPGRLMMARVVEDTITGIAICKDMDFPSLGREYGRANVRLMLVPAWDFGSDNWQHSRVAILRGVEGGYSVARAARQGFLTVSDSYGRVLDQERSSRRPYAELEAKVPIGSGPTVYDRIGDLFGWLVLLFGITLSGLTFRRRRKSDDDEEEDELDAIVNR